MRNELQILEETTHPNIPKVWELFEDDNNYYVITELISGGDMLAKMEKEGFISEVKAAKIIKQVL